VVAIDTHPAVAVEDITKDFRHQDLVVGSVVVTNQTGVTPYADTTDYNINYALGTLTPTAGTSMAYFVALTTAPDGSIVGGTFTDNNATFLLSNVKPGDRLVLDASRYGGGIGSEVNDGTYTIVSVGAQALSVVGSFPVPIASFVASGHVGYAVYARVLVAYNYNPTSVDFAATARTGRELFTVPDVPLLNVTQVEVLDPITGDPTGTLLSYGGGFGSGGFGSSGFGAGTLGDWRVRVGEPNERFSMIEDVFLDFDPAHKGVRVAITFNYSPDVSAIHTYARDAANRVVAADLLAKHMIPAFFNAAIGYEVLASDATTTTTTMLAAISLFIHQLASGETSRLEISDLVDAMYDAGAVKVDLPIAGSLEIHNTDGSIRVVSSEDVLVVPTSVLTDPTPRPLTPRTAHALPGTITLTQSNAAV
jgi:hypothetical protein